MLDCLDATSVFSGPSQRAIEALGGFAEGALVSLVAAPAAAALTAAAFEVVLRGLMRAAAPLLPRTLAPNVAKAPEERSRRRVEVAANRDIHAAFAALKTAAFGAMEARPYTSNFPKLEHTSIFISFVSFIARAHKYFP